MQPFELFIGLRYTRAKRRNHFISFISLISVAGIALGVAALITVLSVMNGFQQELRARILGVASHIQISGVEGGKFDWQAVTRESKRDPDVVAAAPYVMGQGMLAFDRAVQGAIIRGVLPELEDQVSDIAGHMKTGKLSDLRPGEFGIVLGIELARSLGVRPGEKVVLIAPQGQVTVAGMVPRLKQFTLVGVFEAGMYEYDAGLALIALADAQKLYRLDDRVSGVRLKLKDLFDARKVAERLSRTLTQDAEISDWTQQHANFFRAVAIEKNVMFIILFLIVAVAAFNIISTLVMAVTDKQPDIAILRTLGAAPRSIMSVFIVQGALIGLVGTALGLVTGIVLALNIDVVVPFIQRVFGIQFLDPSVYYISDLPSDLQWRDVAWIGTVSLVLSLLATLYPSWRASRINPAEALRYE